MHKFRFRIAKRLVGRASLTLIIGTLALLTLSPIVLTICNSFLSQTEIAADYGSIFINAQEQTTKEFVAEAPTLKLIPDRVSFSQYITVLFKSPDYLLKFWNSVFLTLPIVAGQLFMAILAAYGFYRLKGRFKELLFFSYVILMLMPFQVTLVPNYLVARFMHTLDTNWAILLPGFFSPFAVFLLTKYMRRIPVSVIEAAKVDGATEWRILTNICLPLTGGALYACGVLIFIDYWNMVEQPLIMLSDSDKHPLSVFLARINADEVGLAFALATIYMVPALLAFFYGQDHLVEGVAVQGRVKA